MIKISAAELQRDIDPYQDLALTQAVAVTRNGREQTALISIDEYHPPSSAANGWSWVWTTLPPRISPLWKKTVRLRHLGHSTRRSSGSCLAFPTPVPGLVVRYRYLWASEHARGQEEGAKDRPCAVVLVVTDDAGEPAVTVLPITHQRPSGSKLGVEILHATKRRLGLDDARSWVALSEANRFI